jgi:RNA polymerase sigma-70 factor (ECF subfamily)
MDTDWLRLFHSNNDLDPDSRQELFRQLWNDWWPRLRVYLGGFNGLAVEDAEELASDALLRAMDKAASYDPNRPFAPWLYTLARHLAIGRARQLRHRIKMAANPAIQDWQADLPGPEESLLIDEERSLIACTVAALPERERELAYLVYGAGLSLGDSARITGEPLGTVKWRVHKLKAVLRLKMEGKDER